MKFTDVKTLNHLLKEYGNTPGKNMPTANKDLGFQGDNSLNKSKKVPASPNTAKVSASPTLSNTSKSTSVKVEPSNNDDMFGNAKMQKAKAIQNVEPDTVIYDKNRKELGKVVAPVGTSPQKKFLVIQKGNDNPTVLDPDEDIIVPEVSEGKLGNRLKKKNKKLKLRSISKKIKKLSKKNLKEAKPELFEINFNKKEIALEALDLPIRCGFEAETFWYGAEDSGSGYDIDDMTLDEVESEFGIPDSAYEDYEDYVKEKAYDDGYVSDLVDEWIEENRDEDQYINDFMQYGDGPTMDAVEEYKDDFEENDPAEYQNREEDGWDMDNWSRDFVNEEYGDEYEDYLREIAEDDYDIVDNAIDSCRDDYSMDEWVSDVHYNMSSFLDDYGWEYQRYGDGGVEAVADIFHNWQKNNSKFTDFPETGDYGDTSGSETNWAVEKDSTIDPNEGAGAELISPVFASPREMLQEMKSLFEFGEDEFGTNRSTGLHITMSWQGPGRGGVDVSEPNKLKMALLLGDEYLLGEFDRLTNSYSKSQYRNVLKQAEKMKKGDNDSFLKLQSALDSGISKEKYSSIHFKDNYKSDSESGNQLIEFRIAGGSDYQEKFDKVTKAVIRYATIMKAGYDDEAFKKEYIRAISRVVRKSQEIDPKDKEKLSSVQAPVIDAAKEIVSKKEYFDVINFLERSIEYLEAYKINSKPGADKEWEKSIDDYRKGTGRDPSWMGESINEEDEEGITGYIEPSRVSPSRQAVNDLQLAKQLFGQAVAILARNIEEGNARSMPKAKQIGIFRRYAVDLGMDSKDLESLLLTSLDDARYNSDDEAENVSTLQKGVKALFKKDIVGTPDFLRRQDYDTLADALWQFFQSDDAKDNKILDKLANIMLKINPRNDKEDIVTSLKELGQKRQKNDMYRYLKDSGYGVKVTLLKPGKITKSDSVNELIKFLEPYEGYEHPTSKDHHVNIKSDDRYADVFQMNMIQKMRMRLDHVKQLKRTDTEKYNEIHKKLYKIGYDFLDALKPFETLKPTDDSDEDIYDGEEYLGTRNGSMREWNDLLDNYIKHDDPESDHSQTYNFPAYFDDYVMSNIHVSKYYRNKGIQPNNYKNPEIKKTVKQRFKAIKKLLDEYDKIFQAEGFNDLKKEIAGKNQLDKRNKDFEKNTRSNSIAKLNIPAHSFVYVKQNFLQELKNYPNAPEIKRHFEDINDGGSIFVIPSAHWTQAEDAINGLDIIGNFESANNYFHSWRKTPYNKILSKFYAKYNVTFKDLTNNDIFEPATSSEYTVIKRANVEITRVGDSRAGTPGQSYLVDPEDVKNPISNEPLDRSSAITWSLNTNNSEVIKFKAFDFSVYPKEMKPLVAKEMKNTEAFQQALSNVLQKVVDGDIKLALNYQDNVEGMIKAAGVEDYRDASSSEVADRTNWSNLTDYLKIERGVNDQGVRLLRKVYDQYDSDHNWRPEDPRAIGTERWAGAVKAAYEYIEKNYTVSGGNYFRDGDDVSSIYAKTRDDDSGFDVTTDDYEAMRSKYYDFNTMMMNGIQNYILQPDVNSLVGFLKNEQNDETFKRAVLVSMQREREAGEEPNDLQGHLARGRMYLQNRQNELNSNPRESVFDKFDKLTLEEQLVIVNESEVLEKWSKKYKDSINCSNPKGFSQKAHCAGKKNKANEDKDTPCPACGDPKCDHKDEHLKESVSKGPSSQGLPDNSIPGILNKLLADEMPAWDLKKQFLAYYAIPDPAMLSDFRARRAEEGPNACLRGIVRFYAQKQLDPRVFKQIDLNEASKTKVKQIINESRGLYGRLAGDKFKKDNVEVEFQDVINYPEMGKFDDDEKRDTAIDNIKQNANTDIEWVNLPNKGTLAFAIATLTNSETNEKTLWGRYFREITPNMMGKWSNKEVPMGWKLQHNTALKMEAGLDPQHLIATGKWIGSTQDVINIIKQNGGDNPVVPKLINALEDLSSGTMPMFTAERDQLPAIRDYFGEIMGPIALRGGLDSNGQSETARKELINNASWEDCQIRWPQEMNYALVDSLFKGPNGAEVGISSKGGKGASAGVSNIAKAMERANDELRQTHSEAVKIIEIINNNTALNGPFRLAEYFGFLPKGLEEEIKSYIQEVKKDFNGLSNSAKELISGTYGELRNPEEVAGFNTGFALMSKLAVKICKHINNNVPEFSDGCLAFLNQSAIVQLYCKMGVKGPDTFVSEWRSVYPPQFGGKILLDSGKTYYSSRIGSKFTFKFS